MLLRVRLDGDFAEPDLLKFLEVERVEYMVAMAGNQVLTRLAEPLMKPVRRLSKESGQTEYRYGGCRVVADGRCSRRGAGAPALHCKAANRRRKPLDEPSATVEAPAGAR